MVDFKHLVIALSRDIVGLFTENLKVMGGGHTNRVWLYQGNINIVLKKYIEPPKGSLFDNSLHEEIKALRRVESLNIAPKFLKCWPNMSMIAYKHVKGIRWKNNIKPITDLILKKENIDPKGFRKVSTEPTEILAEGDWFLSNCKSTPIVSRPNKEKVDPLNRASLIHRDIGTNLIEEPNGSVKLIDWQCPAQGDICEDIFAFLSPGFHILAGRSPLSKKSNEDFWLYLKSPDIFARYKKLKSAYAWRHGSYCLWKSEITKEKQLKLKYKNAAEADFSYITKSFL